MCGCGGGGSCGRCSRVKVVIKVFVVVRLKFQVMLLVVSSRLLIIGEIIEFRCIVNIVMVLVCIRFFCFISVGVVVSSVVIFNEVKNLF